MWGVGAMASAGARYCLGPGARWAFYIFQRLIYVEYVIAVRYFSEWLCINITTEFIEIVCDIVDT